MVTAGMQHPATPAQILTFAPDALDSSLVSVDLPGSLALLTLLEKVKK